MRGFLFDVNVWIALVFESHPYHVFAKTVLKKGTLECPVVFCRSTEQSFLRLITTSKILKYYGVEGITNREALMILNALLNQSNIILREEPEGISKLWHQLANLNSSSPKIWMDAYLAAFAIAGVCELVTLDRDFEIYRSQGLQIYAE